MTATMPFQLFIPISIHAPREGSDERPCHRHGAIRHISIHAPREGSDGFMWQDSITREQFLSTLPVRGATPTLSPVDTHSRISIHAPREGSDLLAQLGISG